MGFWDYLAVYFDLPILNFIKDHLWCPFLDLVMPWITVLGDSGLVWIAIAVVLLFFPKTRKTGLAMGAALILGLLVCNVTLKPLVGRIRPYDYVPEHYGTTIQLLIEAQHDFSFPSGHTIASFEGATVLLLYNKKAGIAAMVLACLIAFSRLYLYVHYPTDVIASVILGVAFGFLGKLIVEKGFAAYQARHPKA